MNYRLLRAYLVSVGINVIFAALIIKQLEIIGKQAQKEEKMTTWAHIMQKMVATHIEEGGTIRTTPGFEIDMEAYLLMSRNDLA